MQCGGSKEKRGEPNAEENGGWKDTHTSQKSEGKESGRKGDAESKSAKEEETRASSLSDSYRGKQLPPGMKIKKRVSDEARENAEVADEEKVAENTKDKSNDRHTEGREAEKNYTSSVKSPQTDETDKTSKNPHRDSPHQPADALKTNETHAGKEKDSEGKKKKSTSSSAPNRTPSDDTHSSKDTENTKTLPCNKPTPPHSTQTKDRQDKLRSENRNDQPQSARDKSQEVTAASRYGEWRDDASDDDDDVQLVSVKPGTQKTPPVATVQKTLTSFPGFQPASQVKGQQGDPRGMHSLLSALLKQKKVRDYHACAYYRPLWYAVCTHILVDSCVFCSWEKALLTST